MVNVTDTPNPNDVLFYRDQPGYYSFVTWNYIFAFVALMSNGYSVYVMIYFFKIKKGKWKEHYALPALLFSLVGTTARFIFFLDPRSFFGTIIFDVHVVVYSLQCTFHLLNSLASILMWVDAIQGVEATIQMKFKAASFFKSPAFKVLSGLVMVYAVVADLDASVNSDFWALDPLLLPRLEDTLCKGMQGYLFIKIILLFVVVLIEVIVAVLVFQKVGPLLQKIRAKRKKTTMKKKRGETKTGESTTPSATVGEVPPTPNAHHITSSSTQDNRELMPYGSIRSTQVAPISPHHSPFPPKSQSADAAGNLSIIKEIEDGAIRTSLGLQVAPSSSLPHATASPPSNQHSSSAAVKGTAIKPSPQKDSALTDQTPGLVSKGHTVKHTVSLGVLVQDFSANNAMSLKKMVPLQVRKEEISVTSYFAIHTLSNIHYYCQLKFTVSMS
jgi:hypothetical protein